MDYMPGTASLIEEIDSKYLVNSVHHVLTCMNPVKDQVVTGLLSDLTSYFHFIQRSN